MRRTAVRTISWTIALGALWFVMSANQLGNLSLLWPAIAITGSGVLGVLGAHFLLRGARGRSGDPLGVRGGRG